MVDEQKRTPQALLRQQAEERLESGMPILSMGPTQDNNSQLHELQVHQIELLMQNEELRNTQAELESAKARYFDLYDLAPVGYCTVSDKGLILVANLAAATLLGAARGVLINQPFSRFILTEDKDIYYLERKKLLPTGETHTWEMRMLRLDGSFFWASLRASAADKGECRITLNDISERKRNELRLKKLVEILQHPAQTIQAFLDYALEQSLQLTGSKIGYIYHYHEERREFVLNTWSKEVLPECAIPKPPTCYELDKTGIWGEAVRQRRPILINDYPADNPLKKGSPAGHVQLKKFMTVPIFKEESIVGVIGLANKETDYDELDLLQVSLLMEAIWKAAEQRIAENALRESENRYALTIAAVNDGLWDWDISSGNVFFSPIYYSLLGYDDQAFPATYASWRELVHPEDIDRVEQELRQSVETGSNFDIDLRMKRKSGRWLWVRTRGNSVEKDAEGKALRMVGTLSDITKRKELGELLRQAQKMEVIGTLAGGIAHDFNNILTAILGFAEIVLDDLPPDSPSRKEQAYVIQAGKRAKELVKQILTFSRKSDNIREPLLVQFIVKEALKLIRSSLPTTIEIKECIDVNCGSVIADPTQIHQLLMNLCTNAKQAMGDKGGVLSVSLRSVNLAEAEAVALGDIPAGSYVVLEIGDTGSGISKETQRRIFEPYFTTKTCGEGTGLGLAVVHGIVTFMGGTIRVDSDPGHGATFTIHLPMVKKVTSAEQPRSENIPRGNNESVLVVDDEETIVKLLSRLLDILGYRATQFTDSDLALQAFRAAPESFDLLITDMTMPKLTGAMLAKEVLTLRPGLPVILCTGFSDVIDEAKAKDMGIRAFLIKPTDKDVLAKVVRKVLDQSEVVRQ